MSLHQRKPLVLLVKKGQLYSGRLATSRNLDAATLGRDWLRRAEPGQTHAGLALGIKLSELAWPDTRPPILRRRPIKKRAVAATQEHCCLLSHAPAPSRASHTPEDRLLFVPSHTHTPDALTLTAFSHTGTHM